MNRFVDVYLEQSIIGAILSAGDEFCDSAQDAIETLAEHDFMSAAHRLIIRSMKRLNSAGIAVDLLTVASDLEQSGDINNTGGFAYLAECQKNTPSVRNLPTYSAKLQENSLGMRVLQALNAGIDQLTEPSIIALTDIIGTIQSNIGNIEASQETGTRHIMDGIEISLAAIEAQLSGDMGKYRTLLGLPDIDSAFGGFNNTDLIIVGGRPGTGKTMLSTTVTESVALVQKKPVLFFSLEMPIEQISERVAHHRARIDKKGLLGTKGNQDEAWARLSDALKDFQQAPIYINDKTSLSIHQLRAEARRMHKQLGGLGVIVVDYLQKMKMTNPENMNQSVGEIASGLKNLAKELRTPVIALSQLNRNLEQRANKRPVNSDLRESGVIEQEADVIFMVYRDEKYNPQTELKGITEIICTKSRHAPGAERTFYFSHALSGLDSVDISRIKSEEFQHELEC